MIELPSPSERRESIDFRMCVARARQLPAPAGARDHASNGALALNFVRGARGGEAGPRLGLGGS
jgi:hypothetical protein